MDEFIKKYMLPYPPSAGPVYMPTMFRMLCQELEALGYKGLPVEVKIKIEKILRENS